MNFLEDVLFSPIVLYIGLFINLFSFIPSKGKDEEIPVRLGIFYFIFLIVVVYFGDKIPTLLVYSGRNVFLHASSKIIPGTFLFLCDLANFLAFVMFPLAVYFGVKRVIGGIKFFTKK